MPVEILIIYLPVVPSSRTWIIMEKISGHRANCNCSHSGYLSLSLNTRGLIRHFLKLTCLQFWRFLWLSMFRRWHVPLDLPETPPADPCFATEPMDKHIPPIVLAWKTFPVETDDFYELSWCPLYYGRRLSFTQKYTGEHMTSWITAFPKKQLGITVVYANLSTVGLPGPAHVMLKEARPN